VTASELGSPAQVRATGAASPKAGGAGKAAYKYGLGFLSGATALA